MEVALKVNIDFEEVLFRQRPQPHLNESLEFLAFWVESRALLTKKSYPPSYLSYVAQHTGVQPRVKREGNHELWWGDLSCPELVRTIAQKSFCFNFFKQSWQLEGICPQSWQEVEDYLVTHPRCLLKGEGKMSGRGHRIITSVELPTLRQTHFEPCVLEPLFERAEDISALYVSDEEKFVFYKNQIDKKFQWRANHISPELDVPERWIRELEMLRGTLSHLGYQGPFSVDAFIYRKGTELEFYPGSEINPRKTMGWVNYKLKEKWHRVSSLLGMEPKSLTLSQWEQLAQNSEVLLLSPPENKFLIYWIGAESSRELETKQRAFLEQLQRT